VRIVVISGTELIGSKAVKNSLARAHAVIAASPTSGVDTMTGAGVKEALTVANARLGPVNFDVVQKDARRATSGKHSRGAL
jgi:hypothetical protein